MFFKTASSSNSMATPGRKLDDATVRQIERLADAGKSQRWIAGQLQLARATVVKYLRKLLQSSPPGD
jgi:DNA-binding CsgD family transcriptional regulator